MTLLRKNDKVSTLDEALMFTKKVRECSYDMPATLTMEVKDDELGLCLPGIGFARLTNWSLQQLCNKTQSPTSFMQTLSTDTAAAVLSERIERANLLGKIHNMLILDVSSGPVVRSVVSPKYGRFWDHQALQIAQKSRQEVSGVWINDRGIRIETRSLQTFDDGSPGGLRLGVKWTNSEVGFSAYTGQATLIRKICSNGMTISADFGGFRAVHKGDIKSRIASEVAEFLRSIRGLDKEQIESFIQKLQHTRIAYDLEQLIQGLTRRFRIPAKLVESGFKACLPDQDGDPLSIYGLANGLTRLSQEEPNFDKRDVIDGWAATIMQANYKELQTV